MTFLPCIILDPFIRNFVSHLFIHDHSYHKYFMDSRPIIHSTTSSSHFLSLTSQGVLSVDFTELITFLFLFIKMLFGVLEQPFKTLLFHLTFQIISSTNSIELVANLFNQQRVALSHYSIFKEQFFSLLRKIYILCNF